MTWKEISLGEALHVKHGYAFKGEHFVSEGQQIVLTPGNFNEQGGFRVRSGKDRFYAGDIPADYVLDEGSLIIAMTEQGPGLLGSAAIVPESGRYLHNQRLGLVEITDPKLLDKEFAYYLFNTRSVRGQISGSASGTKVRHTAPERIYRVKVSVPEVSVQYRIAEVARAYDKLIANNTRRIELLERSARILFEEWFIRLRYPGHEHDKIVDGVPMGWSRKTLGTIARTNAESFSSRSLPSLFTYIDIASVKEGRILAKTRMTSDEAPGRARRQAKDGDVIWSNVRPNLRQFALVLDPSDLDVFSTGFTVLTPISVPWSFLYVTVTSNSYVAHLVNHTTGSSYPAVRPDDFERAGILVPTSTLLEEFHAYCEPSFLLSHKLDRENGKLTQARNLLLPRLMDGRIEV
jgi:type I restriction enzyme S subunit